MSIDSVRVKIDRARKHLSELKSQGQTYVASRPVEIGVKRNPEDQRLIYYVARVDDIPVELSAITGDVLQNLRSALDHIAYDLVMGATNGKARRERIFFPIGEDKDKYKSARDKQQAEGMRQDALTEIDKLKPYKEGNETLWRLHRLNIIDKHRTLILVSSAFHSLDGMPPVVRNFEQFLAQTPHLPSFTTLTASMPRMFIKPADRPFPVKVGDDLFIDQPGAQPLPTLEFRFAVALGERGVIEGDPLISTLKTMVAAVDDVLSRFAPLL